MPGMTLAVRLRGWVWPVLVALPFAYYFYLLNTILTPFPYPDAFNVYLWRGGFSLHYLRSASLTQKAIFSLLGQSFTAIANFQLAMFLLVAVSLFWVLRTGRPLSDALLATTITAAFSSYTLNVSATVIGAEPIHLALLLVFPPLLFLSRGRAARWGLLVSGVLLVFSKNTGPILVLLQTALAFLFRAPLTRERRRPVHLLILVGVALFSVAWTLVFDTSLEINLTNNMYGRVFPRPDVTMEFVKRHGMPEGPFIQKCSGSNVNEPCFDGRMIYGLDPEAQNYVLIPDAYGFVDWLRRKGRLAYIRHLFLHHPRDTFDAFAEAFHALYTSHAVTFMNTYLDVVPGYLPFSLPRSNLAALAGTGPGRLKGFFGRDTLEEANRLLVALGFARPSVVSIYIVLAIMTWWGGVRPRLLPLSLAALVSGLALFFVSFFGDAMEIERHVFPSLVLFTLGGSTYVAAGLDVVARGLLTCLGRPGRQPATPNDPGARPDT